MMLSRLDPFFAFDIQAAPQPAQHALRSIVSYRRTLWRPERQITFFGAFKAGKSTLLNSLIGASLLPTRVNRATGVAVKVRCASQLSATVLRATPDGRTAEETIDVRDMARHVLLRLSGSTATSPPGVEEVCIRLPLSFLQGGVLVDTPGLLEDEMLAERCHRELEHTDLAVMVLSADKILSRNEREAVRRIHELLKGNIVCVVNRLDLVDEEDRDEVLDWARTALGGTGNALVGRARVFTAGAPSGSPELRMWLETLLVTGAVESVAVLSRLGILEQRLIDAGSCLQELQSGAQRVTEVVRVEEEARQAMERTAMQKDIAEDRLELKAFQGRLAALGERFVEVSVDRTRRRMEEDRDWTRTGRISAHLSVTEALESYASDLEEGARAAVQRSRLPLPDFDIKHWIVNADVSAKRHAPSEIGASFGSRVLGTTGKTLGASVGGWIEKSVFGQDAEREALSRVEELARSMVPALLAESREYLGRADRLLEDAHTYYERWRRASPRLEEARQIEETYGSLVGWCADFVSEVRAMMREVVAEFL